MKYLTVFACLILCLAATPAGAQAIRNPGFDSNLDYWMTYYENTNSPSRGTATWEAGGSVLLEGSGGPGMVGLAQPTCSTLFVGDSAWVDVEILSASNTTFNLTLGDQHVDLVDPSPGTYHLVIYANKVYPQGTWYSFRALCWPGSFSIRVDTANASLLEGEGSTMPLVRRAMEVHPNPATGRTRVSFNIPQSCKGRLAVYDVAGNLVRNIEKRLYSVGQHFAIWNGRDENGHSVSPGTYFIRLNTGDGCEETTSVVVTR